MVAHREPWLSWNSLNTPGWIHTHRYPPASASRVLGLSKGVCQHREPQTYFKSRPYSGAMDQCIYFYLIPYKRPLGFLNQHYLNGNVGFAKGSLISGSSPSLSPNSGPCKPCAHLPSRETTEAINQQGKRVLA